MTRYNRDTQKRILELLEDGKSYHIAQIAEALELPEKHESIKWCCHMLCKAKLITRVTRGVYKHG